MVALVLLGLILAPLVLASVAFLLGFRIGGEHYKDELLQVRLEAAEAEKQLHNLTKSAFVAMTEYAQRRRGEHLG